MTRRLDADETVLYRLKKSKTPIAFMVIFFPVWLYFGILFLLPYCRYLFSDTTNQTPEASLLSGLAALVVFIPVVIIISLSYTLNDLVITDRRVYIRKGLTGRTQIVNLGDIRSFQHAYSTGRQGRSNNRIYFYLYCGQLVKTGNLFITFGSLETLLELLRGKFEGRGFTGLELRLLGEQNPDAGRPIAKTNPFVQLLLLAPFILASLATAGYLMNQ